MVLLERDGDSASILDALDGVVSDGDGRFVLVGGEAGVGKTSLVRAVASEVLVRHPAVRTLWGRCDDLSTPRVLGPLLDVADAAGREELRTARTREEVFRATMQLLQSVVPAVVVIEDAHWADEALRRERGPQASRRLRPRRGARGCWAVCTSSSATRPGWRPVGPSSTR